VECSLSALLILSAEGGGSSTTLLIFCLMLLVVEKRMLNIPIIKMKLSISSLVLSGFVLPVRSSVV
jgi:hypothetical protein